MPQAQLNPKTNTVVTEPTATPVAPKEAAGGAPAAQGAGVTPIPAPVIVVPDPAVRGGPLDPANPEGAIAPALPVETPSDPAVTPEPPSSANPDATDLLGDSLDDEDAGLPAEKIKTPVLNLSDDQELLSQLLTDPQGVVKSITESVLANVQKASEDRTKNASLWNAFYASHADLDPEVVELTAAKLRKQWKLEKKQISWKDGSKILADESRRLMKRIRGDESTVTEIDSSRRAVGAVPSSGNPAPKTVTEQKKPQTFADQMKEMQRKRGKTNY